MNAHLSSERLNQLYTTLSNKILELHILPTEKCNFRCVYCYEDFKIARMPANKVKAVKKLISNRMHELGELRLSWFGGEPLLAKNVVFDISQFCFDVAKANHCKFSAGITTNGYLLDLETFNSLVDCNVNFFQISLDGYQGMHDKTRILANKNGTFDKIWGNLTKIAKSDKEFTIMLRVHITPENYQSIYELLDALKNNFGGDKRFRIFLKAIANLGGPKAGTFDILTGKTKKEVLIELSGYIGDSFSQVELSKQGLPYICYAAAFNALVIRANGSLAKCTVAFDDERNDIGQLNDDGTLTIKNEMMMLWLRGLKTLDANVMSCPYYGLPQLKNIPIVVENRA